MKKIVNINKNGGKILICVLLIIPFFSMVYLALPVQGYRSELTLNSYDRNVDLWGGYYSEEEFYYEAPQGVSYVEIFDSSSLGDLVFNLTVTKDDTYIQKISTIQNLGRIKVTIDSPQSIYIILQHISGSGSFKIRVYDDIPLIINIMGIIVCASIFALSAFIALRTTKSMRNKISKLKFEKEIKIPIPKVYKFLLKYYAKIKNLNIEETSENQWISTEMKETGVRYSTTRTSNGTSVTRPVAYTVRNKSMIEFISKGSKNIIKMNHDEKKQGKYLSISIIGILLIGPIFGVFMYFIMGIGMAELSTSWVYITIPTMLITMLVSLFMPRQLLKQYEKSVNDQFQRLINKPLIQMQMELEESEIPVPVIISKPKAPVALFCKFCGQKTEINVMICESCGNNLEENIIAKRTQ